MRKKLFQKTVGGDILAKSASLLDGVWIYSSSYNTFRNPMLTSGASHPLFYDQSISAESLLQCVDILYYPTLRKLSLYDVVFLILEFPHP